MSLPSILPSAAGVAERYLTLLQAHPTRQYNYASRGYFGLPVFEVEQHRPKCKQGESWLYFAVPDGANPQQLKPGERLYVGAQTQDRMFRGDQMGGSNFHHAEMRAGNGPDTPAAFLKSGSRVVIYRAAAHRISAALMEDPELSACRKLTWQPSTPAKHRAWWFEQYILHSEAGQWRWNTAPSSKDVIRLFL